MIGGRTAFDWIADAEIKTADAVALVEKMVVWFRANYEDPAESTPYDSGEGGYQYIWGGPCDAREELKDHFSNELESNFNADEIEEILEVAAEEIEEDGTVDWAPIVLSLLYASKHRWGEGHVHVFNEFESKTLCGKTLAACPGELDHGGESEITCKACQRIRAARIGRSP